MLKNELPILFQMQSDFIKPLFVSFYYMQLNIFYTLYNRMEELKIPYFDLSTDVLESYHYKKGNIEEQADAIGITHFKVGHAKSKLEATKRRYAAGGAGAAGGAAGGTQSTLPPYSPPGGSAPAYGGYGQQPPQQPYGTDYKDPNGPGYQPQQQQPAPGYGGGYGGGYGQGPTPPGSAPAQAPGYGTPQTTASSYGTAPGYGSPQQPPAPPTPSTAGGQTCTALYEYTAQAQGDLTFPAGAVIEIVERTADTNGWWTGRYNGQTGAFPGNYVQLN